MEGFNDIVITLGYLGGEIESMLGDGSMYGVHIEYVYEKEKLGTAGGVKNAEKLFEDEPFLVVGGDHVMDIALREFYRFHEKNHAMVTIGLIPIDDPRDYGIAELNVNNRITRFHEKPKSGEIFSNLASTGIYVCEPEVLKYIPKRKYDFAKNLFPELMKKGECINGYLVRGKWSDIGNPLAYREACHWMLDQMPGTKISGSINIKDARITGPIEIGHNVTLSSNSYVVGPVVIGENTTIGSNVLIGPYTSIGSNCTIGNDSRILSSYIFDDVCIGNNTAISGAIIDKATRIEDFCILEAGTVIGPRVIIGKKVIVHSNVRIWPEISVSKATRVKQTLLNKNFGNEIGGS